MKFASGLALLLAGVQGVFGQNTAGCGRNPPSSGLKSINVNGMNRQYILQLPDNYDSSKGHMLIFGLHWLSGSMNDVHPNYYGLRGLAGNNAIFIAPNGIDNGWANPGGRDVAFIDAILDSVRGELCIDESQIFATGFSYGGGMSYALGCARANVFRAIAPIAGAQISGCDGGTSPIAFLGIHGTQDDVLPISMGRQVRDRFVQNNGCQPQNAPEPNHGQGPIKTEYSCQPDYPVTWIAFSGGHDPNQPFVGPEIWDFFQQFGGAGNSPGPSPGPTPNPNPTPVPPPAPGPGCSGMWGQCGGMGWNGPTCCSQGTCQEQNPWYSQCL